MSSYASPRPQRGAPRTASSRVATYAEDDGLHREEEGEEEEEEEDDEEEDEDEEDEEEQDVNDDGGTGAGADPNNTTTLARHGNNATDDAYARLQGAVARHRQVAALAAGMWGGGDGSNPNTPNRATMPALPRSRPGSIQKRISRARIEAIENVVPPDAGDTGWMPEPQDHTEATRVYSLILHALGHHQVHGRRCADALNVVPNDSDFMARVRNPLTLRVVQERVLQGLYPSSRAFEADMMHLFTECRRGYTLGSQPYADTVILQRLYQRLARSHPRISRTTLAMIEGYLRTADPGHHFASVPFGPGTAQRGQNTDLTTRPIIRGKKYFTHALHKGLVLKVGDWVQLSNASEPGKPIVAQIFKVCKREDDPDETPQLSCCWYFRPEQTVHPPSRRFVPEEIFKTGLFADHSVEDVIEKVHVLFYTKWTKGRPGPKDWDPRSPLYFTESRYNEKSYEFNKIKNWNSCLPEELRGSEAPLIYFPEPAPQPVRVTSPFLRGVKGPGRLCEESSHPAGSPSQDIPDPFAAGNSDPRKRQKSHHFPEDASHSPSMSTGPSSYHSQHAGSPLNSVPRPWAPPSVPQHSPAFSQAMGTPSRPAGSSTITPRQAEAAAMTVKEMTQFLPPRLGMGEFVRLSKLFASPAALNVDLNALVANLRAVVDAGTLSRWRDAVQIGILADLQAQMRNRPGPTPLARGAEPGSSMAGHPLSRPSISAHGGSFRAGVSQAHPPSKERSLAAALGSTEVYTQTLPDDTVTIFGDVSLSQGAEDQASLQTQVRWFPAPPLDLCKKAGGVAVEQDGADRPSHSLAYLYHRALKAERKKASEPRMTRQDEQRTSSSSQEHRLLEDLAQAMADVDDVARKEASRKSVEVDGEEESVETRELARLLGPNSATVTSC